jgi:hypothetical protein
MMFRVNTVHFGENLIFQMNIPPPSSRLKSKPSKKPAEARSKFATLFPNYKVLQPRLYSS